MIHAIPLEGIALSEIQAEFEGRHRESLMTMVPGSGRGRAGYKDGWISEGIALYRPAHDSLGVNLVTAITELGLMLSIEYGHNVWLEQVILNRLAVGARLDTHVDGPPYYHRWHLPIYTLGTVFIEGEKATQQAITMREGFWYGPISHWLPHSTMNDTVQERIHAIVDFGPEVRK